MSDPVLSVEGLHVAYQSKGGQLEALHDISFELAAGETLGIVGESGCGKSTLASAIMRLLPPNGSITGGRVSLHGEDLTSLSAREMRRIRGERLGMIFQDPLTSLNPTFRISTQMINAQRAHPALGRDGTRELRRRAVRMLSRVGIDDAERRIDDYPHQFSGGMRQRIMVATALLLGPEVLICDEATSALDVTLQAQILRMLKDLCQEQNTAMIIVSHDVGVISQMCDQVKVLYAGRVIEGGSAEAVLTHAQHPYTRRLIAAVPSRHRRHERLSTISGRVPSLDALPPGCTFAPRCHAARLECEDGEPALFDVDEQQVRCLLEIRDSAPPLASGALDETPRAGADAPAATPQTSGALLEVQDLHVHFPIPRSLPAAIARQPASAVRAVDGVDLSLDRGEIVGLVGESGSGKTTLGKALLQLTHITAGSVTFDGAPLVATDASAWRKRRRQLQMIFQEPYGSLSPRFRVEQLVTEPYRINKTPQQDRYDVDYLLELVGLSREQATKYPHELSGGQARRVGVARALAVQPQLVVADEPTSGLDVSAAASVLNLLQDLRARLSLTLLIITHDLNVVGYVADRIAVMQRGEIVEIGTADEVMDSPRHPYTQKLLASIPEVLSERHA